jgi:hypothetical protein
VDLTTRWPEVFPVRDTSAATCVDAFTARRIARFGVPAVITTDKMSTVYVCHVERVL